MSASPDSNGQGTQRHSAGARRTALIVAAIAVLIYVGFILLGVFGQ